MREIYETISKRGKELGIMLMGHTTLGTGLEIKRMGMDCTSLQNHNKNMRDIG